jgi:hydroxymethylpyrimidine pyrophosphatase-like HAD family hydrolase
MGCVVSDGEKEEVLPSSDILGKLKNLETALKSSKIPEIYKFAERRAIISMFTFYGTPPEALLPKVNAVIQQLRMGGEVKAACSSVAVDVFPVGFSKITGMRHVARGGKVMGIADSMNDAELVAGADAAVVPSNSKKELLRHVAGMKHVRVSSLPSTEAVIESLELVGKPGAE